MRPRTLIALAALAIALVPAAPAAAGTLRVAAKQRVAVVLRAQEARTRPDAHAPVVQLVEPTTPLTHERTRLPVLDRVRGPGGVLWLRVRLPGRPNGHSGWIRQTGTRAAWTPWAVVVDLARRQVIVFLHGRPVKRFEVVVGRPSAPTPRGWFFVEESLQIVPGYPGGPFALALSARSNVYSEFDGGPGQVAFHGIDGIGGTPGTAESHGCIRVATADMLWLGDHIRGGVPVLVTA